MMDNHNQYCIKSLREGGYNPNDKELPCEDCKAYHDAQNAYLIYQMRNMYL